MPVQYFNNPLQSIVKYLIGKYSEIVGVKNSIIIITIIYLNYYYYY